MAKLTPAPDSSALKTLAFLGKTLRTKQFVLRRRIRARNQALYDEQQVRQEIFQLLKRIDRELDRNPGFRAHDH